MIKAITESNFHDFWPTFSSIIDAQQSYALEPDMDINQAYELWCKIPHKSYALIEDGQVLGIYYLKANAMGPSKHICNCGYMVAEASRGRGVAKRMCEHSQHQAKELGYLAMQFNNVVSTNTVAVSLWEKLGFSVIGTIPRAYNHKQYGYVDSFIMYKWLT
ncbi:GNAT family N-acetyltransferase [Pseudoalteromonas sp. SSDWG2]|uniref:GNAT family N-acetyltransferase n=1 Tax=Pseudoalteromonas sp. SSDWG2 TaxID=3139391 RepID=UPI003BAD3401